MEQAAEAADAVAEAVAQCESEGDNDARPVNPITGEFLSSASGYWQAIDSTWEWVTGLPAPASDYPKEVQRQFFDKLWANGDGALHWSASAHCWWDAVTAATR